MLTDMDAPVSTLGSAQGWLLEVFGKMGSWMSFTVLLDWYYFIKFMQQVFWNINFSSADVNTVWKCGSKGGCGSDMQNTSQLCMTGALLPPLWSAEVTAATW